jgi:hydrogenase maturation protein HypF
MTSGNPSAEPLTCENAEALERLGGLADAFLFHDRDIERRVDDSVIIAADHEIVPIRRARGYAPSAVLLHRRAPKPVLAVGGELKAAICLYRERDAVISEHLGDLASPATYRHFCATVDKLQTLMRCEAGCIAYDLHPGYLATQYAQRSALPKFGVQHHHAHIVSCMAENGVDGPVIGIAADGTGYGLDGAIWGCELLLAEAATFERVGHLRYFDLPGGDVAATQTIRPAWSVLSQLEPTEARDTVRRRRAASQAELARAVDQMLRRRTRCVATSSLGRLFDAVAFLLGLCDENGHEAQAAMALEDAAQHMGDGEHPGCADAFVEPYPFAVTRESDMLVLDWRPMIEALVRGLSDSVDGPTQAARFHETIAMMLAEGAASAAAARGIDTVALSGGCFANCILLARTRRALQARGLATITHRRVPPGDGGLSLGQAVAAATRME